MQEKGAYSSLLERGEAGHHVFVPASSESRMISRRNVVVGAAMFIATVAVLALAMHSQTATAPSVSTVEAEVASGIAMPKAKHVSAPKVKRVQKLEGEDGDAAPAAPEGTPEPSAADEMGDFVPNVDKIHFPNTWESFAKTFGAHLTWALIVLGCAALTWVYVRFVRPQSWFKDLLAKASAASLPVNVGATLGKVPGEIDENDVTGTLVLVPGEAVFFHEEAVSKTVGTVTKLSITNHRVIGQRAETTLCGTCQVGAREDAWPIESVSKVSVITGEFNGHSVSGLIHYTWAYFGITMAFDLLQAFVVDNIQDFLGAFATQYPNLVFIIDTSISLVCNVLFLIAIVYAFAAMALVIWPHTLIKIYLKREMEEEGSPAASCSSFCCGTANSKPLECYTFKTNDAYKAYQAIIAARSGAGTGRALQGGAYNQIPSGVFSKASAPTVLAEAPKA